MNVLQDENLCSSWDVHVHRAAILHYHGHLACMIGYHPSRFLSKLWKIGVEDCGHTIEVNGRPTAS